LCKQNQDGATAKKGGNQALGKRKGKKAKPGKKMKKYPKRPRGLAALEKGEEKAGILRIQAMQEALDKAKHPLAERAGGNQAKFEALFLQKNLQGPNPPVMQMSGDFQGKPKLAKPAGLPGLEMRDSEIQPSPGAEGPGCLVEDKVGVDGVLKHMV
jgi:hypothetical protein